IAKRCPMKSRTLFSIFTLGLVSAAGCSARPDAATITAAATSASVPGATLHFAASGAPTLEGAPIAGGSLKVDYDYHRLLDAHPECIDRSGYERTRVGVVQMGLKLNDDASRVYYYDFVAGFAD